MEKIQELITRKGPGHLFQPAHIVLALMLIEKGPIGRHELGRVLDLGGGTIRTLVNRLKDANLIAVIGKKGHILSENGKQVLQDIREKIIHLQNLESAEELTHQKFNTGCQARAVASKIGSGITLRDSALSVGAKSITSIIFTGDNFIIPTFDKDYLSREHPKLSKYLQTNFDFKKEDALIVCGADNALVANLGAITAVLSLLTT